MIYKNNIFYCEKCDTCLRLKYGYSENELICGNVNCSYYNVIFYRMKTNKLYDKNLDSGEKIYIETSPKYRMDTYLYR